MRRIFKLPAIILFRLILTRSLLRLLFGEAFSDPKFSTKLLWKCVFIQKVLGINRHVKWPVHWTSQVKSPEKIERGNRYPGLSLGCYLDGRNGISIGENTWIGPGAKIISMNHESFDYEKYVDGPPIQIGRDCWLASNSIILPGVTIGDHTIVAAGAVVTKSFPDGNQGLGGVPATVVKAVGLYNNETDNLTK